MSLIIRNSMLSKIVAKIDVLGTANLEQDEVRTLLNWLKTSPVADHITIQFGGMSPVRADAVSSGAVERQVALLEEQRAVFHCASGVFGSQQMEWPPIEVDSISTSVLKG